jgi:lambda family phage portal protein
MGRRATYRNSDAADAISEISSGYREAKDGLNASYDAAKPSRFQRTRIGLGGSADRHYTQAQLWRMREYSRDTDRNDLLPFKAMFSRAAGQIVKPGLMVEPQTGDPVLDAEIKAMWLDWSRDPAQVDRAAKFDFVQLVRMVQRQQFVDGDAFVNPLSSGHLELIEADLCATPPNEHGNQLVHVGVDHDRFGRPRRYWFTSYASKQEASSFPSGPYRSVDAFDSAGRRNLFHSISPERSSLTRGIPVFAAAQISAGIAEDLNFAQLLKAQVAAAVALFIEREGSIRLGSQSDVTLEDGNTGTIEGITPGQVIKGRPGEKITGFSPAIPTSEFFQHIRLMLRFVGSHIGLPLELITYDTEHTTFHGYRGALTLAREGFTEAQVRLESQILRNVYSWWLRRRVPLLAGGRSVSQIAERGLLFRHRWNHGRWPYVDPSKDAAADRMQLHAGLDSPRGVTGKRGLDFDDIARETVEDRGRAIRLAAEEARKIQEDTGYVVDPMILLGWEVPAGNYRLEPVTDADPEAGQNEPA